MQKVLIAFDVDGTLRNNLANPYGVSDDVRANERIRNLLVTFASMKNTKIMVWSGGGELYARQVARAIHVDKYVDVYADKCLVSCDTAKCEQPDPDTHWHFGYDGPQPDIAIDDIQDFSLGKINLIVHEK